MASTGKTAGKSWRDIWKINQLKGIDMQIKFILVWNSLEKIVYCIQKKTREKT